MAFTQKRIDVQFQLANGQFDGGGNTMKVTGLRVQANVNVLLGGYSTGEFTIYGLPLSVMNQLSTTGSQYLKQNLNGISVAAGDDESGTSVIFTGQIFNAFVDAYNMPNVCLRVSATPGTFAAIKPVPPTTLSGAADASGLISKLAKQMGFQFEDAGVNVKLSNPYYPGTAWQQMLKIARDAGVNILVDRGAVTIVPPGKARAGSVPLISPQTGMVGYPTFNQAQVLVTALFDPAVKVQGQAQIKSDLTSANGTWAVLALEYDLESVTPHGNWFMHLTCVNPNAGAPS